MFLKLLEQEPQGEFAVTLQAQKQMFSKLTNFTNLFLYSRVFKNVLKVFCHTQWFEQTVKFSHDYYYMIIITSEKFLTVFQFKNSSKEKH